MYSILNQVLCNALYFHFHIKHAWEIGTNKDLSIVQDCARV